MMEIIAKVTVARIQESDSGSAGHGSPKYPNMKEEPGLVSTQEDDLEQEDREDYLTDPEDQ